MRRFLLVTLVLPLLLACVVGAAAEEERGEGPRIGLVLSGGGAKGWAHVGVLKVLEELRIPIHAVAGTSAGSIVGGLYASGLAPDEIERILLSLDPAEVLDDRPSRRQVPYRRKMDDPYYIQRLEVGFNRWSFQLPRGLVTGQKLDFFLNALTLHTTPAPDFDHLQLPFRAVATDIETGEMVVLRRGSLGRAMRASMSIPGAFSPVELDGRLLVDGGMVRNLPVDVMLEELAVDVVIAVDVGSPYASREDLRSLLDVTGQVINMMVKENVKQQLPLADVVIRPDVESFTTADFAKVAEIIPLGVVAARSAAGELERFSVGEEDYAAYLQRQRMVEPPALPLTAVRVEGIDPSEQDLVLSRIQTRAGQNLDVEVLGEDLRAVFDLAEFERVGFHLEPEGEGWALVIEVRSKSWGPHVLRLGLDLRSDLQGGNQTSLRFNYTLTRLNRLGAEARLVAQLGDEGRLLGEVYQPLRSGGPAFVSGWVEYVRLFSDLLVDGERIAEYRLRTGVAGFDLGLGLGRFGEVRLGAVRGRAEGHRVLGLPGLDTVEVDLGGYRLAAVIDQLDSPTIPKNGYLGTAEVYLSRESLGADDAYDRLSVELFGARTRGRSTVSAALSYDSALGGDLPFYERFHLGGLFQLSGYAPGEVFGLYGGVASLRFLYRVADVPGGLGGALFVGVSAEAGNLWETKAEMDLGDLRHSGALLVGVDSILGPVYLAYGRGDSGHGAWYFSLGRAF